MIRLRGIRRVFRVGETTVEALAGIDLEVDAGEHLAIMGPSGSGKSTLLNVLGCLDRPTAGSYELDGREVARLSEAELTRVRRHKIGFVFQSFHLVPRLTAAANVELPMIFAGVPRAERRRRAAAMLEAVGLAARADHRPEQMSGGERQRVAIARAMVMGPKILLADEPTGNLDSRSGRQVLELLESLHRRGLTLIVVTHDPAVARRAARLVVLHDGRIVVRARGPEEIARALTELTAGDEAEDA
ncbi:MAG: ABC transporter ATP-binding protein [Acidobacteria bacterium]|nr:MAG: ABC transporter ATP-binding protein [Acidobacteriota bacterium]